MSLCSEYTSNLEKIKTTIDSESPQSVHVRIVPSIDNPNKSIIFDIVDRELKSGSTIRIGRYSERNANRNCMSFKSKVVSRSHCEVWTESDGKLYIRDTKSSSGTFLNHVRLCPAGIESKPVQLHDGDIVQLGVDFQGGREEMYRSVKMKFELNRSRKPRPLSFSLNAFENIRSLTQQSAEQSTSSEHQHNEKHVEECCICLYALAPFQALFVSPCSHSYHYKCIRPLLSSYPGFQCPICRSYSDLEASVTIEEDEPIVETKQTEILYDEPLDIEEPVSVPLQTTNTCSTTYVPATTTYPDNTPPIASTMIPDNNVLHHVIEEALSLENEYHEEDVLSNSEEENEAAQASTSKKQERRSSQFMEKIKTVFFEKRKSSTSSSQQPKQRKHNKNKPRPLSYPNLVSINNSPAEIPPLPTVTRTQTTQDQTLSRQSTSFTGLPDIPERRPFIIEAMIFD